MLVLPSTNEACAPQRRNDVGVALRRRLRVEDARPGARDLAGAVEKILDRERNARVSGQSETFAARRIDEIGLVARAVRVNGEEAALAFAGAVADLGQALLDQRAARYLADVQPPFQIQQILHEAQ